MLVFDFIHSASAQVGEFALSIWQKNAAASDAESATAQMPAAGGLELGTEPVLWAYNEARWLQIQGAKLKLPADQWLLEAGLNLPHLIQRITSDPSRTWKAWSAPLRVEYAPAKQPGEGYLNIHFAGSTGLMSDHSYVHWMQWTYRAYSALTNAFEESKIASMGLNNIYFNISLPEELLGFMMWKLEQIANDLDESRLTLAKHPIIQSYISKPEEDRDVFPQKTYDHLIAPLIKVMEQTYEFVAPLLGLFRNVRHSSRAETLAGFVHDLGHRLSTLISMSQMWEDIMPEGSPINLEALFPAYKLNHVMEAMVFRHRAQTLANGVQVTWNVAPPLHDWRLANKKNRLLFDGILENFLGNAIKYSRGGNQQGEDHKPKVHLDIAEEDDSLRFTVEDNGLGMAPEELARFGVQRWRSEDVLGRIEGNGIGAQKAFSNIEFLGGRIEKSSQKGAGTTLKFWLPKGLFTNMSGNPMTAGPKAPLTRERMLSLGKQQTVRAPRQLPRRQRSHWLFFNDPYRLNGDMIFLKPSMGVPPMTATFLQGSL